jgi:hypothetical protein
MPVYIRSGVKGRDVSPFLREKINFLKKPPPSPPSIFGVFGTRKSFRFSMRNSCLRHWFIYFFLTTGGLEILTCIYFSKIRVLLLFTNGETCLFDIVHSALWSQIPSLHARRPSSFSYLVGHYVAYATFRSTGSPRQSIDS